MWLVKVKLYGIIPNMLPNRMNMNRENTKGKYFLPSLPTVSTSRFATNSYEISAMDCHRPGTSELFRIPKTRNSVIRRTERAINAAELVKAILVSPTLIGINSLISNCASGLCALSATIFVPFSLFSANAAIRIIF